MLALSRGRNETVIVGNDVKVTVLDIRVGEESVAGGRVKLGFQAPREVSILRQEVFGRARSKTSSGPRRPKPHIFGQLHPVPDA